MQILPRCKELLPLLVFGSMAVAPLLLNLGLFHDLFLFGDEWDQLDQISQHGYWHWVFSFFGENFAPLFKLTWGAGIILGGGGYFVLIVITWIVHVANVVLLGLWLRKTGFGWAGTLCAMALLGLTSSNIETLAWTVQLLTLQGMALFLTAAIYQEGLRQSGSPLRPGSLALLVGLILASTLSFIRGILVGGVLALAQLWPVPRSQPSALGRGWSAAALCLLPSIAVALLVLAFTGGNHQPPPGGTGTVGEAVAGYALSYFFLNPFHRLLEIDSFGWHTFALLACGKLVLLGWSLRQASPMQRRLLVTVLAFDVGTALLLGIGRYHTGIETTISSRYQYTSLICSLPFAAVWIDAGLARLVHSAHWRQLAGLLLAISLGAIAGRRWPAEMQVWSDWRGRESRELLSLASTPPAQDTAPGIPSMSTARAKELIRRYNLH